MSILVKGNGITVIGPRKTPPSPLFKMTIDTTKAGSASNTFVLKLHSGTTSMTVYWGDGNSDVITAWNQAELTHVYASSGTYQISCDGQFHGIRFYNGGDKLKLASIDNWGTNQWGNMTFSFWGCTNMVGTYTDSPDLSYLSDLRLLYTFNRCSSFNSDVSWDTSNITSMQSMFEYATNFNQPVNFNTSNVTNMEQMFFGATNFNQSVSSFDTSIVTTMYSMFRSSAFNQSVSSFDTSNVTNMGYMFFSVSSFNQDLSGFNISSLTSAIGMLLGTAFSTTNYDLLLVAWEGQTHNNSVTFHAGTAKYSSGAPATARAALITDSWTITDGGAV